MTIDSPKDPVRMAAYQPGARDRVARWYRDQWGYRVNSEATLKHADDALEAVRPEVERLTAENQRLVRTLTYVQQQRDEKEAEVSRLREQLAAQPEIPADADDLIRKLRDAVAKLESKTEVAAHLDGGSGSHDDQSAARVAVDQVIEEVGAAIGRVGRTIPASAVEDLVEFWHGCHAQFLDDAARALLAKWSAPVSESVPATPASRVETAATEEFDAAYKGHGGQCVSFNGSPEYRCEWMVGHEGDHRRYVGPYRWELWKDAADAARSGATLEAPPSSSPPSGGDSDTTPRVWADVRGCEWEEVAPFDELRLIRTDPSHCREVDGPTFSRRYVEAHYGPLVELTPPSPSSLPQEGGTDG